MYTVSNLYANDFNHKSATDHQGSATYISFQLQVGAVRADPNDGTSTWVWAKDRSPIDVGGNPPSNPSRFCAFFYIRPNRFYALHCTSQPKNTFWCELPREVAPFPISHVIG